MIALQSLISLAALLFLLLVLFNSYREDRFRQQLFELRDQLFDDAVAGRISFDSKAYRATRFILNGMLRFAHRVSLSRFVVAMPLIRQDRLRHAGNLLDSAFDSSSVADRELCQGYIGKANVLFARHLMSSPFSFVALVPCLSFVLARGGFSLATEVVKRLHVRFAALDRVAYAEGCH